MKQKMRKVKMGLGGVVMMILLLGCCVSASSRGKPWRAEEPLSFGGGSSFPSSPSMVFNRVGSSIVFPLDGNVYPTGSYNTTLFVGQPPRPYFLDPDTGSDLTWLQCDAPCVRCTQTPHPLYRPNNDLVMCRDPICASLQPQSDYRCESPEQCDYKVEYADQGSSLGVLVKDIFSLRYTNGAQLSPRLVLGCGYDQIPGQSIPFSDGVLGLGKGKSSLLSQLNRQGLVRNIVGHCLSGRGGGYLFFGDDLFDSSRVVWTQMSHDDPEYYSPGMAELSFGGKSTGLRNLPTVFDSGSSFTYLSSSAYQEVSSQIKKELVKQPLKEALEDRTLPLCWKGRKPFKNVRDVKKYFKHFTLSFTIGGRSKAQFDVPPESYLIISSKGNVCLGVLNGTEAGLQNLNVVGDISMLDKMVVYDNERQLIGWTTTNCDRLPKTSIFAA